jgi:hypothetical protein
MISEQTMTKFFDNTETSNPTGNETELTPQTYSERIRISGESEMTEDKIATEIAHNTLDYGGNILSMIINGRIFYGNNSDFLPYKKYEERFIFSPIIGHIANSTSYYGSGGSTIVPNFDGSIDYTIHVDKLNQKYYLRKWNHINECDDDKYTESNGNNILFSGGCNIVEYELTIEDYKRLAKVEELKFEPTFFVMIRRFTDSHRVYSPSKIGKSVNVTMIQKADKLDFKVRVDSEDRRGAWYNSRQLFFPYVKPLGKTFIPISNIDELPPMESFKEGIVEYEGAKFKVRIFKKTGPENYDEYQALLDSTDDMKDILPASKKQGGPARGSNGIHYVFDMDGKLLQSYDSQTLPKNVYGTGFKRDWMNNNVVVIQHIEGEFKFPTVKSGKPKIKFTERMVKAHIQELEHRPELKHSQKKIENSQIDGWIQQMIEGGKYQSGLIRSYRHITEKKLDESELTNSEHHESPDKKYMDRECDWLISKEPLSDDYMVSSEFARGNEDWEHIDSIVSRTSGEMADYIVYVVEEFSNTKKYRQRLTEYCNNSKSKSSVWCVQLQDLLDGNVNSFRRIKK